MCITGTSTIDAECVSAARSADGDVEDRGASFTVRADDGHVVVLRPSPFLLGVHMLMTACSFF
jgi:hypothetical protein